MRNVPSRNPYHCCWTECLLISTGVNRCRVVYLVLHSPRANIIIIFVFQNQVKLLNLQRKLFGNIQITVAHCGCLAGFISRHTVGAFSRNFTCGEGNCITFPYIKNDCRRPAIFWAMSHFCCQYAWNRYHIRPDSIVIILMHHSNSCTRVRKCLVRMLPAPWGFRQTKMEISISWLMTTTRSPWNSRFNLQYLQLAICSFFMNRTLSNSKSVVGQAQHLTDSCASVPDGRVTLRR